MNSFVLLIFSVVLLAAAIGAGVAVDIVVRSRRSPERPDPAETESPAWNGGPH